MGPPRHDCAESVVSTGASSSAIFANDSIQAPLHYHLTSSTNRRQNCTNLLLTSSTESISTHQSSEIHAPRHRIRRTRTRRTPRPWSTVAAILVSSILVTSPLMLTTVTAMPSPLNIGRSAVAPNDCPTRQHFGSIPASHASSLLPLQPDSDLDTMVFNSDTRAGVDSQPTPFDDQSFTDDLEIDSSTNHIHRRYAEGEDTPRNLFDMSGLPTSSDSKVVSHLNARGPSVVRRYTLPSSYPSSIASSWSRPERSVWFQSKAIIITSCFLAIFIILFIGAAVFLRERKLDDELAEMDDDEALARLDERMNGGARGSSEKDGNTKSRFRLGRKKHDKEMKQVNSSEPSTGSSSGVKRRRHIVSRWTKRTTRDSRDTFHASDDSASIRSARSSRRAALGNSNASERVEITYDDGTDLQQAGSNGPSDSDNNRPRSPPPPHTLDNEIGNTDGHGEHSASDDSTGQSPTSSDLQGARRRTAFDDSDFQAAELAETHDDARHMPPAYISSGLAGSSSATANNTLISDAMARGDSKRGIPAPAERDQTIPADVIRAALANDHTQESNQREEIGTASAHIATDDKVMLGALTAAASMPSAPSASNRNAETSAPAYGAQGLPNSGNDSNNADDGQGPSAPTLEVDEDGFEVASDEAQGTSATATSVTATGKGKARQDLSPLPLPPQAVEPAFSRFDQPYRAQAPYISALPQSQPSTPGRANIPSPTDNRPPNASLSPPHTPTNGEKSEKQKEAELELAQLVASRPAGLDEALDVPRYEHQSNFNSASAPPLAHDEQSSLVEDGVASAPVPTRIESLPAYERTNSSDNGAPSAPPVDETVATENSNASQTP